ncbi:MAG: CPBP family glutamic-type intramembrane protease [Candidatus Hodarchaeales archaeon]|jgi:membrane protease YdiL (CAAX protease family)
MLPQTGEFELSKDFRELLIVYTITIVLFTIMFNITFISFWANYCLISLFLLVIALFLDRERIITKLKRGIKDWRQSIWRSGTWAFLMFLFLWIVHLYGIVLILTYLMQLEDIYNLLAIFSPESGLLDKALIEFINRLIVIVTSFTIIGPCEEIFWRGYFQQKVEDLQGNPSSALLTTSLLHAFVFIAKGNMILFTGLFLANIIWGYLYIKNRVIVDSALSHGLVLVLVLVVFPL